MTSLKDICNIQHILMVGLLLYRKVYCICLSSGLFPSLRACQMEIFTPGQRIKLNKSLEPTLKYKPSTLCLSTVFVLEHLNNSNALFNQKFSHLMVLQSISSINSFTHLLIFHFLVKQRDFVTMQFKPQIHVKQLPSIKSELLWLQELFWWTNCRSL